ncbi:MAG: ECF-type sigma factor [Pirellulales bacterium]
MSADESMTRWIDGLRAGEDAAARRLWESFFDRLLAVARQRLRSTNRAVHDDEDVVLSAFKSFCLGVRNGRFPQLRDREDLWRLLFVITARKIADQFAFQGRAKRSGEREIELSRVAGPSRNGAADLLLSAEPSPEFAAECADQLRHLLEQLQHEDLQQVAILKMEGYTNEEIAQQLRRGLSTIERKLRTIREIWNLTPT